MTMPHQTSRWSRTGLLNAGELLFFSFRFFLMLDARRRRTFWTAAAWAGFLVGLGLFQPWDGIADHKLLRLHQIRYRVEVLPYDIAWNTAGGILLLAGIIWTIARTRLGNRAPTTARTEATAQR